MSLGVCEVGYVWQNTHAWAREKLKGGSYRNILKIHFDTNRRIEFTDAPPPFFEFIPFFSVQTYPKRDVS